MQIYICGGINRRARSSLADHGDGEALPGDACPSSALPNSDSVSANIRRRRSTPCRGDASNRESSDAPAAARSSDLESIHIGRAAIATCRRLIYIPAAEAAAGCGHAASAAARRPDDRRRAARPVRDAARMAGRPVRLAGPRRSAASLHRCRRRLRSIRWHVIASVDSSRAPICG